VYDQAFWSLISPTPFNMYVESHDAHLTYWNGVAMTQTYARMITGTIWFNLYYDESSKLAAFNEYNNKYRSGAFKHRAWDNIVDTKEHNSMLTALTKYLVMKDTVFLINLRKQYTPQQALAWFLPSKEYVCEQTHQ